VPWHKHPPLSDIDWRKAQVPGGGGVKRPCWEASGPAKPRLVFSPGQRRHLVRGNHSRRHEGLISWGGGGAEWQSRERGMEKMSEDKVQLKRSLKHGSRKKRHRGEEKHCRKLGMERKKRSTGLDSLPAIKGIWC